MTARRAASTVRSNSICNRAKMPTVIITSCTSAATEPTENFFSKRNHM